MLNAFLKILSYSTPLKVYFIELHGDQILRCMCI